ncbi:MAG: hypothetical protein Q4F05_06425 [bacterium]|nr:hypothetical protein [bacterium]
MNLDILNSPEFQKDLTEVIQKINKQHNLSIKCGQICCDKELFTIYIEDEEAYK